MNGEEREFNTDNNVGMETFNNVPVNNGDSIIANNQESVANIEVSRNAPADNLQQSSFMYDQTSTPSIVQMPTEEVSPIMNESGNMFTPETSASFMTEVPISANNSATEETQNPFLYTDTNDVTQEVAQENSKQYVPQSQTVYTNSHNVDNQDDMKSNFKFMIVLAIIMLAIVVALPYIGGYK